MNHNLYLLIYIYIISFILANTLRDLLNKKI